MAPFCRIARKIWKKIRFIIRRRRNVRELYIYPETQDGWTKCPQPVIGNRRTGSYFDPYVCKENGKFSLYVSERRNGSIVRFDSKNGSSWERIATILQGQAHSDWEAEVNRGCVRKIGERWFLWYTGQANGKSAIGVAISDDGINYKRYGQGPILRPTFAYEGCAVMNPSVLYDHGTGQFQMWYCAGEQCEPDVICYATSSDGLVWEKCADNPVFCPSKEVYDRAKVGGCDVFRRSDGEYGMFYIGYQNIDNARICYAQSPDGKTKWRRSKQNPILSPSRGKWDAHALYKPAFFEDISKHKCYLWYNGRKGRREYIGLATKKFAKTVGDAK